MRGITILYLRFLDLLIISFEIIAGSGVVSREKLWGLLLFLILPAHYKTHSHLKDLTGWAQSSVQVNLHKLQLFRNHKYYL